MSEILNELTKALNDLKGSIKKDLTEVYQQKAEVQALSEQIHHTVKSGKYLRDEERLILSAPEIIIGNVDHNGELIGGGGGSVVVMRGNTVSVEGAGIAGSIVQRAPSIKSIAVDPGPEGMSAIVGGVSEIVSQARSVTLLSHDDEGSFVRQPSAHGIGISIEADTQVNVNATPSCKLLLADIENQLTAVNKSADNLAKEAEKVRKGIDKSITDIEKLLKDQGKFNDQDDDICNDYQDIDTMNKQFLDCERIICLQVSQYVQLLSAEAEMRRREKALKAKKQKLNGLKSDFAKKSSGAMVSIMSESVYISNVDGDGNIKENAEAGLFVQAPHVGVSTHDKDGKLIKDSTVGINTQRFELTTGNRNVKYDDKGKPSGNIKNEEKSGILINSSDITIQATDEEYKDGKLQETALTKGSSLTVRTEKVLVSNTDTQGKSTGSINLNAKDIKIAAYDVDKEKRTDTQMAKGSQLQLLTEKMFVGSNKDKKAVQLLQLAANKVGVMGKETAELQEGEAKSVVTLSGGNVTAGGSKVDLKGNTTIEGNADIKGATKTPKLSADQVEAKSAFKSPNINDTMGAGMPGQPGKPSAKLKEEEPAAAAKS